MQFARELAPLVVLHRDEPAQQVAIVLAEVTQRAGELVGRLATPANLRRAGGGDHRVIVACAQARQAGLQFLQRANGRTRREIGAQCGQQHQRRSRQHDRKEADPFLVDVGREVGREQDVADPVVADRDRIGPGDGRDVEQRHEPARHGGIRYGKARLGESSLPRDGIGSHSIVPRCCPNTSSTACGFAETASAALRPSATALAEREPWAFSYSNCSGETICSATPPSTSATTTIATIGSDNRARRDSFFHI